jgi:hypothetical protein
VQAGRARSKHFDRVICVIDRDTHHNFDAALQLAGARPTVELIVSYPCFEYWLLLHFVLSRREYVAAGEHSAADLLIRDLRNYAEMNGYEKGKVKGLFDRLLGERLSNARTRSPRVLEDAIRVSNMNPSTQLHDLISMLESLGQVVRTSD